MSAETLRRAATLMRKQQRRLRAQADARAQATFLAVADWLDFMDARHADDSCSPEQTAALDPNYRHALGLARAYLGES